MERGVEVRGFYYWSLLDNFEWQFGYSKKFGLLSVDFMSDQRPRAMKALGLAYRDICRENAIPASWERPGAQKPNSTNPLPKEPAQKFARAYGSPAQ